MYLRHSLELVVNVAYSLGRILYVYSYGKQNSPFNNGLSITVTIFANNYYFSMIFRTYIWLLKYTSKIQLLFKIYNQFAFVFLFNFYLTD